MEALNDSTNCLVCYSYAFEPIITVSRLMCNDSSDAYAAYHEQGPNTMQVRLSSLPVRGKLSVGNGGTEERRHRLPAIHTCPHDMLLWLGSGTSLAQPKPHVTGAGEDGG